MPYKDIFTSLTFPLTTHCCESNNCQVVWVSYKHAQAKTTRNSSSWHLMVQHTVTKETENCYMCICGWYVSSKHSHLICTSYLLGFTWCSRSWGGKSAAALDLACMRCFPAVQSKSYQGDRHPGKAASIISHLVEKTPKKLTIFEDTWSLFRHSCTLGE